MLIEDKIEKLEKWVGELSAENRRLQEQVKTLEAELKTAKIDVGASIGIEKLLEQRAEAAEAERDRLREAETMVLADTKVKT